MTLVQADILARRCVDHAKAILLRYGRHGFHATVLMPDGRLGMVDASDVVSKAEAAWTAGDADAIMALRFAVADKLREVCTRVSADGIVCVMEGWLAGWCGETSPESARRAVCVTWEFRISDPVVHPCSSGSVLSGLCELEYARGEGGVVRILSEHSHEPAFGAFSGIVR